MDAFVSPLEVLLVEDDDAVRGVVLRVLTRLGHRVRCCATVDEALDADTVFQLALVDLNLGRGGDGLGLLETLRCQRPKACLALTSGERPNLPDPNDGGPLFLKKPFSKEDLVQLLDQAREKLAAG